MRSSCCSEKSTNDRTTEELEHAPVVSSRTESRQLTLNSSHDVHVNIGINPFGFDAQTYYTATESLLKARSDSYDIQYEPEVQDIWSKKPPDFRPQSFAPRPPKRNSREAMQPWNHKSERDEYYKWRMNQKSSNIVLPKILYASWMDPLPQFETRCKSQDPHESRVESVRSGFKNGIFFNPKPHDFRGLPPIGLLGLDEFVTDYEKDPFNIKFESQRLHTITGPPPQIVPREVLPGVFVKPVEPFHKWRRDLVLKKDKYPERPGSYTRFRRERPANSAFQSRVAETITSTWAKEKMDEKIRQHNNKGLIVNT